MSSARIQHTTHTHTHTHTHRVELRPVRVVQCSLFGEGSAYSYIHAHTSTHSFTHTLAHSHTHTCTHTFTHTFTHPPTHSHTHRCVLSHIHSLTGTDMDSLSFLSLSLSLSLSHTHTHTHSLINSHFVTHILMCVYFRPLEPGEVLVFLQLSFVSHPGRLVQPLYDAETGQTRVRQNKDGE